MTHLIRPAVMLALLFLAVSEPIHSECIDKEGPDDELV